MEIALHAIVTDCRLCACLTAAYYRKEAKSSLWQDPRPSRSAEASLLIKPSQIEYPKLDEFPAAAYVLDYPDLAMGTEEPTTLFETSSEELTTYAEVCTSKTGRR